MAVHQGRDCRLITTPFLYSTIHEALPHRRSFQSIGQLHFCGGLAGISRSHRPGTFLGPRPAVDMESFGECRLEGFDSRSWLVFADCHRRHHIHHQRRSRRRRRPRGRSISPHPCSGCCDRSHSVERGSLFSEVSNGPSGSQEEQPRQPHGHMGGWEGLRALWASRNRLPQCGGWSDPLEES